MENKIQNELVLNGVVNIKLHKGMINNIEDNMIVINNEDGTKIVIIKEHGNWRVLKWDEINIKKR